MAKVIGFNPRVARNQKCLIKTNSTTKAFTTIHTNDWFANHGTAFVNSVVSYIKSHGTDEQKEEIAIRELSGTAHLFRNCNLFTKRQASKFLRGRGVVYDYLINNIAKNNQAQA